MDSFVGTLLAEAPRILDEPGQQALTERFLAPALPQLEALFLRVRAGVDDALQADRPMRAGRPYPLGQCLTITAAALRRLDVLDPADLPAQAAAGHGALSAFLHAGGALRRTWGDLRGEYFQNALLIGTLYVDVANDTVAPTKPKVEILPFHAARFSPIEDYAHYARIAGRYWGERSFPNHVLPELAPYLPLIHIGAGGEVRLGPATRYMLGLTLADAFAPSETTLRQAALPRAVFTPLAAALAGHAMARAGRPEQGRAAAAACCGLYRAEGRQHVPAELARALQAAQDANRRLAAVRIDPARQADAA